MDDIELSSIISSKLAPARGGRRSSAPFTIGPARELTSADLSELIAPSPLGSSPEPLKKLRSTHHRLAQLIAEGMKDVEISLITGYSQSRISILKSDPAFRELVAFYQLQQKEVFINVQERLADLGMAATEEIRERLEDNPAAFSVRELLEVQSQAFDRSIAPVKGSKFVPQTGTGNGVTVNVQFVDAAESRIIDIQADEGE